MSDPDSTPTPDPSPTPEEAAAESFGPNLTFWEHLEELRSRLIRIVIMIVVGTGICYLKSQEMLMFLLGPVWSEETGPRVVLQYIAPFEAFMVQLKIAFLAAIFLGLPYNFYQLWRFIAPGLKPKERRWVVPFLFFTVLFFAVGAWFAWIILPAAIAFFKSFMLPGMVEARWTLDAYSDLVLKMFLGFGLVFETPILIFFLARFGLVSAKSLVKPWRFIIVGIFIVAGFITPGPDVVSQLLIAGPMLVLYVISIFIALAVYPRSKKKMAG